MSSSFEIEMPKAQPSAKRPLTEAQIAFVDHYARYRNATQAARHAYPGIADIDQAGKYGSKLLRDQRVQNALKDRFKRASQATGIDVAWLLQRFVDIATADPRELIGLRVGCCRYCHGDNHLYQWREREYIDACAKVDAEPKAGERYPDCGGGFGYNATIPPHPTCPQCHGEGVERFVPRDTDNLSDQALLLYGGVKVKNGGYEIIIADRQKALDCIGKILGAYTESLKVQGQIASMVAVADLRNVDPHAASRAYREMISGKLAA